jgi:signal transduction histidine kinase
MPIDRTTFVRTSALLLIIGLAALVAIVGTTLWLVQGTSSYFDEVIEARDARAATVDLRYLMQDVEIGQRGFLLTGDERYLEPYLQARDRLMPQYEVLNTVLAPYPQAEEPMARLRQALEDKIAEVDETIALYRAGDAAGAIGVVTTDRGKELMDEARELLGAIVTAADARLTEGVSDMRGNMSLLQVVTIGGGLLIVLVVGGSVWSSLTYTRELLEAEAEVKELNAGLEQRVADRTQDLMRANEEVQRFAYIVTHDLRAPLVNIMGFTSELESTMKTIRGYVLADGEELSESDIHDARQAAAEDLPEAIDFIRSSTRKMDGLINAILKISRDGRRPIKPEVLDLRELVEANLAAVQHQVQEADGETRIDVDLPRIVSDRMALEQAIGNLIDNAVKYRDKSRPLRIEIKGRALAGRQVAIDVSDNGRGIAEQDHVRVFDLFRRSGQQDQPGEGIGLAHVRTLLRNLGGDITLSSELGKGTTFTILLPNDVRTVARSTQ